MPNYAIGPNYTRALNADDPLRVGELELITDDLESAVIDYASGVARDRTEIEILNAKRAQIIEQINAERDRREQLTFPYLGKLIDSDPVSVQRITVASSTAQMALVANVPFELDWSCADNSFLTLDAMGVLGMMQALGLHGVHLHYYARGLKATVEASEDPESIDILNGWPE